MSLKFRILWSKLNDRLESFMFKMIVMLPWGIACVCTMCMIMLSMNLPRKLENAFRIKRDRRNLIRNSLYAKNVTEQKDHTKNLVQVRSVWSENTIVVVQKERWTFYEFFVTTYWISVLNRNAIVALLC